MSGITLTSRAARSVTRRLLAIPLIDGDDPTSRSPLSQALWDARTVSNTSLNGKIRFTYLINLGYYDMTANATLGGDWKIYSNQTYTAFSTMEQKNTFTSGTGTIGTGNHNVSQSTGAIGSCTFLSIPNDTDVTVKLRGFDSNGTPFFSIINLTTSAE